MWKRCEASYRLVASKTPPPPHTCTPHNTIYVQFWYQILLTVSDCTWTTTVWLLTSGVRCGLRDVAQCSATFRDNLSVPSTMFSLRWETFCLRVCHYHLIKTHRNYIIKVKWAILARKVTGIYCESITELVNASCGNNIEFVNVWDWW